MVVSFFQALQLSLITKVTISCHFKLAPWIHRKQKQTEICPRKGKTWKQETQVGIFRLPGGNQTHSDCKDSSMVSVIVSQSFPRFNQSKDRHVKNKHQVYKIVNFLPTTIIFCSCHYFFTDLMRPMKHSQLSLPDSFPLANQLLKSKEETWAFCLTSALNVLIVGDILHKTKLNKHSVQRWWIWHPAKIGTLLTYSSPCTISYVCY